MSNKYYTFITINGKSIRIEETENEHNTRIRRLRGIRRKQEEEAQKKAKGIVDGVDIICPKCGNIQPYSTIPKYRECVKCSIISMYK